MSVYNKIGKKSKILRIKRVKLRNLWCYLCVKEFPEDDYDDKIEGYKAEEIKEIIGDYLEHRLKLSKKDKVPKER